MDHRFRALAIVGTEVLVGQAHIRLEMAANRGWRHADIREAGRIVEIATVATIRLRVREAGADATQAPLHLVYRVRLVTIEKPIERANCIGSERRGIQGLERGVHIPNGSGEIGERSSVLRRAAASLPARILRGLPHDARTILLNRVRELMRQQPRALVRSRLILPCPEHDVIARRVRERVDGLSGRGGARIVVNTDVVQIVSQARFHERARRRIERTPGVAEYVTHLRRRVRFVSGVRRGGSLDRWNVRVAGHCGGNRIGFAL